jgi:hypothetical protein
MNNAFGSRSKGSKTQAKKRLLRRKRRREGRSEGLYDPPPHHSRVL